MVNISFEMLKKFLSECAGDDLFNLNNAIKELNVFRDFLLTNQAKQEVFNDLDCLKEGWDFVNFITYEELKEKHLGDK